MLQNLHSLRVPLEVVLVVAASQIDDKIVVAIDNATVVGTYNYEASFRSAVISVKPIIAACGAGPAGLIKRAMDLFDEVVEGDIGDDKDMGDDVEGG